VTTRKDFLLRSGATAVALSHFGLGGKNVAEAATRPNVLVIFTDDQPPFGSIERMPFVREFFLENGLVYDRAYLAGPKCAPSRATMQLGRYPHSHNIVDNKGAAGQYKNAGRQHESVVRQLRGAGYSTALIGKWMNGYENLMGTNSGWAHPYFEQWYVLLGNYDPVVVNSNGDIKVTDTRLAHETDLLRDRCEKGQSYEESSRNPLMVRGPAVAQGHIQAYSSLVDVPATIADLAGIGPFGEGRSLVPTFGGTVPEDWRKRVFFEMPSFPWYAVRDDSLEGDLAGDWKYVENGSLEHREIELYDMANDPYELTSLHRERPDVCAALNGRISTFKQSQGRAEIAVAES
jgi:arylsulfatase A-like enzyme